MTENDMKMEKKVTIIIDGIKIEYLLCNFHSYNVIGDRLDKCLSQFQGVTRLPDQIAG